METISEKDKYLVADLPYLISNASKAGYFLSPTLCFEGSSWIQFNELSSGEQNILSVGAKLIAYATPGCLIAIDEPEISLNVAWQQHYTDLIHQSLANAPKSHVLIATHSPHLINSLAKNSASVIIVDKVDSKLVFKTVDAQFEGWGSESVLYDVLGIPSASSFLFNQELAKVLRHIQDGGKDKKIISEFLKKASRLDFAGIDPLKELIAEIEDYSREIN